MNRAPSRRAPPTGLAKVAAILLCIGVLGLCPLATCGGIAWLKYRSDSREDAPARTAEALVTAKTGWNDPFSVVLTPHPERTVVLTSSRSLVSPGFLVPVDESRHFALLVKTPSKLTSKPVTLVVHRSDAILGGGPYFGVNAKDLAVFVQEDLRVRASGEGASAGTAALVGLGIGAFFVPLGAIFLAVARRKRT